MEGQRLKKSEQSRRDLWNTNVYGHQHIHCGSPEGNEKEKWAEKILEIIVKKTPKFDEIHEDKYKKAQQIPSKMNSKRTMPRQDKIKLSKEKDKKITLKKQKRRDSAYKGSSTRVDFSTETSEVKRQWANILKMFKKPAIQQFYSQQNCPSKVKKKLRHSQINKSNAQGRPAGWNKRTFKSNSKPYDEIKNYVLNKGKYMAVIL